MPNYSILSSRWNSTFAGSTLTTVERLNTANGWTISGAQRPMVVPTYLIYNTILSSDFLALDSTQRQQVRDILNMGTVDVSAGTQGRARIASLFAGTASLTALIAVSTGYDSPPIPYVTASTALGGAGLPSALNMNDLAAAGLS